MKFYNLDAQQSRIKSQIDKNISKVLQHGKYILGPEVDELEQVLSSYTGAKHCISCANGTDALQIALMSFGVGLGDEVIVPGFTYIAAAEAVAILGAKPIYVDILPGIYNIDPAKIEEAITARTKAIIVVSLFGQCPDFDEINKIGKKYGVPVIEDAAQSFGAVYKGMKSCNLSDVATTSFFPTKPLGCYGDGGAIFTSDPELARTIKQIAQHGQEKRYHHVKLGMNSRLDSFQAAVLLAKMSIFDDELVQRSEVASRYLHLLSRINIRSLPFVPAYNKSVWAQFTIEIEDRDKIRHILSKKGIPTAVHYPRPLSRQPAVFDQDAILPNSEKASRHVISLPMCPYTDEKLQRLIVCELEQLIDSV